MDFKRVTSALLGLPMVIAVLLFGNKYIIDIVLLIVTLISLYEFFNAFSNYKPIRWIGYISAVLLYIVQMLSLNNIYNYLIFATPIILIVLFMYLILKNMEISIIDISITFLGIVYIVVFINFLSVIAESNNGKVLIWIPFLIAWGTDIFAYLIGKTLKLGKHKFSKISPNKSIEGCIGGIIGAILFTMIYIFIINKLGIIEFNYCICIIYTILLSIIGQFGDLAASSIKRFNNIKDFSNLIPGHGGLLDRIDSLIFIAPCTYILFLVI